MLLSRRWTLSRPDRFLPQERPSEATAMNWLQDSCRKTGRRSSRSVRLCPAVDRLERRELLAASISEFPIPSPDSGVSITQGSDGNLWFSPASEEGQPTLLASINPGTHSV